MQLPTNEQNWNAFHAAAVLGNSKTVAKLVSSLKRVLPMALLAKDERGNTPAHLAAIHGNLRALRLLIDTCPEALGVKNSKSLTVLDILRHCEDVPYTFELRTRLVAWGSASLGENALGMLDQPQIAPSGVDRFRPRTIVEIAMGNTPMVISQTGLDRHINMGPALKRSEATVNPISCSGAQHSIIATPESVYSWGPNNHGQLGLDRPANAPTALGDFLEYKTTSQGGFDALKGHDVVPVEPLAGTECCSQYTVAWTTTKLYGWGVNRGQFPNKPEGRCKVSQFYGFKEPIQGVACLDKLLAVLVGGRLVVFEAGEVNKTGLQCSQIKGRGRTLVLKSENKLHVYGAELQRVPLPKSETVLDFDVSETGVVVIATKHTVYTYKGGSVSEVSGAQRFCITSVACDARAASFIGVQQFYVPPHMTLKGNGLAHDLSKVCPVKTVEFSTASLKFSYFEGGCLESVGDEYDWLSTPATIRQGDCFLVSGDARVPVHRSILLGRAPSLANNVTTRRGCAIKMQGDDFVFSQVSAEALAAFVHYLYTEQPSSSPANQLGQEYRDLQTLVKSSLPAGLLRAKSLQPDVEIKATDGSVFAHSYILASRLPYFTARLAAAWKQEPVQLQYSKACVQLLVDYIYSGQPSQTKNLTGSEDEVFSVLFELWYLCDEIMYSQLAKVVESALIESISLETCLDVLDSLPAGCAAHGVAKEFCARHMDYFITAGALSDSIENFYRKMYADEDKPTDLAVQVVALTPSLSSVSSTTVSSRASPASSTLPSPLASSRASPAPKMAPSSAPSPSPVAKPAARPQATPASAPVSAKAPTPVAKLGATPKSTPISMPWARNSSATPSPGLPALGSPTPLPQLGKSMPKLGSSPTMRPRTTSVPRISRVSQKERRRIQLDTQEPEPSSSAAPWGRQQNSAGLLSEQIAMMRQKRTAN